MTGRKGRRITAKQAGTHPRASEGASFPCCQCGARIPVDSDRCPECRSFYVKDVKDEEIDELVKAERAAEEPRIDFVETHGPAVVHFDTDLSMISLLDDGCTDPGFVSECSHCGTVVELSTSRCPMCGAVLEHVNIGLLDVFADMEFDPDPFEDADCPYCGEHVTLRSGDCPSCGKAIDIKDKGDPTLKVRPVLKAKNVVFMHLDIETGEIDVPRRNNVRHRYDQMSVHLNAADNGDRHDQPGTSKS